MRLFCNIGRVLICFAMGMVLAPQTSGTSAAPITFRAEDGPDTVYTVGSETAGTLGKAWQPLSTYTGAPPLQPGMATNAIYFIDAAWVWE